MTTLFDETKSEAAKVAGMATAANNRHVVLEIARNLAQKIASAKSHRTCHADEVYAELPKLGYDPAELGPAAGSIFAGKAWEFTGVRVKSKRVSNHSREIKVWRLK